MNEAIIVTGMGRSGTSALAGALSLCGAGLPEKLLAANHGNPTGYFEPIRAVQLNDKLLSSFGSSWYDFALRGGSFIIPQANKLSFDEEVRHFFKNEFERPGIVVLKDPRITGLLPLWIAGAKEAGFDPKIVHIFRNPVEVAASLAKRDGLAADHSNLLWLKYNLMGERDSRIAAAFRRV